MQLYDPKTNSWYNYNPKGQTQSVPHYDSSKSIFPPPPGLSAIGGQPPPGGTGLIAPEGSASDMAAQVLAGEFENWRQQFKPLELNLLNQSSLNNPQVLTDAVSKAGTIANQSFDAMGGVRRRRLAAQGVAPTADQQMVTDRISSLSKAAAVAGAENKARQQVEANDEMIALGVSPNPNLIGGQRGGF